MKLTDYLKYFYLYFIIKSHADSCEERQKTMFVINDVKPEVQLRFVQ